jgi:hypothetical protein
MKPYVECTSGAGRAGEFGQRGESGSHRYLLTWGLCLVPPQVETEWQVGIENVVGKEWDCSHHVKSITRRQTQARTNSVQNLFTRDAGI